MIPAAVARRHIVLPETGIEIAVQDWGGDGPLALLHHANGFCAGMWAPVAERLRDRFRVVAMDARGAGDSPAPVGVSGPEAYAWRALMADVRGVAEVLCAETGRPRVALGVGHSFGGTLIMAAEAQRPGHFARIVAIDPVIPAPLGEGAADGPPNANLLAERALRRRHVWPSREAARAHFAERELFRAFTPRALDLYVAEGLRARPDGQVELKCSPEAESGVFSGAGGFDVFSLLRGLRTPVLMLWARRGSFPRALYEQLVASMDAARIEDVDTGHLVPMEDPEVVLDAIGRFGAEG